MALTRVSIAATARTASQELSGHPSLTRTISKEATRGSSADTSWRWSSATQSPHLYTGATTEISTLGPLPVPGDSADCVNDSKQLIVLLRSEEHTTEVKP